MFRPARQPLGLHLTRVSRVISRAFDDALAKAGGSLPVWLVLISLKSGQLASQRELADAVGVKGATLTHHLDAMESAGLVTRHRDPSNRRLHVVRLTPEGEALFLRLRDTAVAFDQRLRTGLSEHEVSQLETLLTKLRDNVAADGQCSESLSRCQHGACCPAAADTAPPRRRPAPPRPAPGACSPGTGDARAHGDAPGVS